MNPEESYTTEVTINALPGDNQAPVVGMRAAIEVITKLQRLQTEIEAAGGVVGDLIERACSEAKKVGIKCKPPQDPSHADAIDFVADLLNLAAEREDLNALPYLTVEQAAAYLQVSKDKIYDLCKAGDLPSKKVGRVIRIMRSDLDQLTTEVDDW